MEVEAEWRAAAWRAEGVAAGARGAATREAAADIGARHPARQAAEKQKWAGVSSAVKAIATKFNAPLKVSVGVVWGGGVWCGVVVPQRTRGG